MVHNYRLIAAAFTYYSCLGSGGSLSGLQLNEYTVWILGFRV
jgi:hypothetical protein